MEGNSNGKFLIAAIMLIALLGVVSASYAHYSYESEDMREEGWAEGMAEMHNAMMGTSFSEDEVLRLHQHGCFGGI